VARKMAVDEFLCKLVDGQPAFILSPNCTMLRKGFNGGYRRKKVPGMEEYYDEPEKNVYSHYHDALQYLSMSITEMEKLAIRRNDVKKQEARHRNDYYAPADSVVGY
jgi:hypothetical protein